MNRYYVVKCKKNELDVLKNNIYNLIKFNTILNLHHKFK